MFEIVCSTITISAADDHEQRDDGQQDHASGWMRSRLTLGVRSTSVMVPEEVG